MVSEEECTETAREAPREDTYEDHDDHESEHIEDLRTEEQAPAIIVLMITFSQLFSFSEDTLTRSSIV